jgi:hypothetical protein
MAAMSRKKTLVWGVVLLALAAFYYVNEIQGGKKRREAAKQQALLVHFAVDEAASLTVKRPTETVTAVKRQGHWHLTVPLSAPGDDHKYRELVRYISELRQLRLVEERPASLEPFGLTSPGLEIHLQLKEQTQPLIVRLGAKNPTGSGYYAHIEGRSAVYLINTAAKDVLDASLYTLRDKAVLDFDLADVQKVHIESKAVAHMVLQRQDNDRWHMTTPVNAQADGAQVQALLQRLHEVKVQAFVAENPIDLEPYGLHAPTLRLALTVGKDRTVKTLLFGKLAADQKGVYVKRSDAANVLLLPQQFRDDFPKTTTALRDKTLLQYDREHIVRIDIQSPDEHTTITRTGERQYRLEQPINAEGDGGTIYNLLGDLQELKAKDFVAETPTALARYGLESARLRVTLSHKSSDNAQETVQHTILFGDEAPDQQGTYVRLASRPTVYLVERSESQRIIDITAFDLRNKKIVAFDTDAVQKIRLQYPASTFTLERHDDSWRLSEPEKRAIRQPWKVDNLLYELSALEYTKIVTETAKDHAPYGLDTPQAQITLWQENGPSIGPLVIGQPVDSASSDVQLVYAQVGQDTPIYAIKANFFNDLPKNTAQLVAEK